MDRKASAVRPIHGLTAIAIGMLCWAIITTGHELIGHGGACLATGGKPLSFNAMYFHGTEASSFFVGKIRTASGSAFNVTAAFFGVFLIGRLSKPRAWFGYFLWIFALINLFQAASYILFSRFIHPGMDWAAFLESLNPAWLWHVILTLVGGFLFGAAVVIVRKFQPLFLDRDASSLRFRLKLMAMPYLGAGLTATFASLMVPTDDRILLVLGAVGNSFYFLLPLVLLPFWPPKKDKMLSEPPNLQFNLAWIIVGIITALFFVFVIGPGIRLG